ncbi:hypothetical protein [Actinomadura roseirufa]|uniref:hypothetical protein n=1 Tax=Actinomadura roseirufa TaxID=2094049 RepID=UPI00104179EB|nr:hypothetical protein [Actinomadura roseirufa]
MSNAWENELAGGFEALLGRPLGAYPAEAEYAVYCWDDETSAMMMESFLGGSLDLAAIARGELPGGEGGGEGGGEMPFGWDQWDLDPGRSLWLFDEGAFELFGAAIGEELRGVSTVHDGASAVSGADFARVLAAHGGELEGIEAGELAFRGRWLQRARTDGTLFDAMRTATWTMAGPEHLASLSPGAEVEPERDEALAGVSDARLRDHLRMLCLTAHWARGDGAYFLGAGEYPPELRWIADQPGHEPVAGWEFGEGQGSSGVFAVKAPIGPQS